MDRIRGLIVALFLGIPAAAHAEPISDPASWAQSFKEAALKTDPDSMLDVVRSAADPRLNIDGIKGVLQTVKTLIGGKTAEYAENFGEKNAGTFFKRINVAVKYPGTILFYSIVFVRDDAGWQVVQFNVDGNLNKIIDAPWPA